MSLYKAYVDFVYTNHCYWYKMALKESKIGFEEKYAWSDCVTCGGEEQFKRCFELNPNSDLENEVKKK